MVVVAVVVVGVEACIGMTCVVGQRARLFFVGVFVFYVRARRGRFVRRRVWRIACMLRCWRVRFVSSIGADYEEDRREMESVMYPT